MMHSKAIFLIGLSQWYGDQFYTSFVGLSYSAPLHIYEQTFFTGIFDLPRAMSLVASKGASQKTPGTSETLRTTSNPRSSLQRCVHRLCRSATAAAMWHGVEIRWFPNSWLVCFGSTQNSSLKLLGTLLRRLHWPESPSTCPAAKPGVCCPFRPSWLSGCRLHFQRAERFFSKNYILRGWFPRELAGALCFDRAGVITAQPDKFLRTWLLEVDVPWVLISTCHWPMIFLIDLCLTVQSRKTRQQLYLSHSQPSLQKDLMAWTRGATAPFSAILVLGRLALCSTVRKRCCNWFGG